MIADLGTFGTFLVGLAALLTALNSLLATVLHRRTRREIGHVNDKVEKVESQLNRHYERVEGTYRESAAAQRELLSFLQGFNMRPPEPHHG